MTGQVADDHRQRTDWGGRSIEIAENRISAYEHIDAKDWMSKYDGTQPYDPRSAAKVIYESAGLKVIPLRLAVGEDAYEVRAFFSLDSFNLLSPPWNLTDNRKDHLEEDC